MTTMEKAQQFILSVLLEILFNTFVILLLLWTGKYQLFTEKLLLQKSSLNLI